MRTDPEIVSEEEKALKKLKIQNITRKVAITFVAVVIYYFFIKLLFL